MSQDLPKQRPFWLDSDGDGLSDVEERRLGTNPYNKDTDGDGIDDLMEIKQGSNPVMANYPQNQRKSKGFELD